jgi:hypothetical protein
MQRPATAMRNSEHKVIKQIGTALMTRRSFLALFPGTPVAACSAHFTEAQRIVDSGILGPVAYCRTSDENLLVSLSGRAVIGEVDLCMRGVVICGSRATLFVNGSVCRLFHPDGV